MRRRVGLSDVWFFASCLAPTLLAKLLRWPIYTASARITLEDEEFGSTPN